MPGCKSPGIIILGVLMFNHVIAHPNGTLKFYYGDRVVTYPKDGLPTINFTLYNKDKYGVLDRTTALWSDSLSISRDELRSDVSSGDSIARRNSREKDLL